MEVFSIGRVKRLIFVCISIIVLEYLLTPFIDSIIGKKPLGNNHRGGLLWNPRSSLNLLTPNITPANRVSIKGWWLDHSHWKDSIDCVSQKWSLCTRSLSSSCYIDKVRAVFQYVPLKDEAAVTGLDLSLTAEADISDQNSQAILGAVVMVKLNNSVFETFRLTFVSPVEPGTQKRIFYDASVGSFVQSVTVMLICRGFSGSVRFSNIQLLPRFLGNPVPSPNLKKEDVVASCPNVTPRPARHVYSKEQLNINYLDNVHGPWDVTLTTQISMDRMSMLERTVSVWTGPVSLVIFVPVKDNMDTEWQRIYIQKKLKSLSFYPKSHVFVVFGSAGDIEYPINNLRNIAIKHCETRYCLLSDADFQPSLDFQSRFTSALKSIRNTSRTVFVVPAFEYVELPQKRDSIPQTKEELLQLLHREDPFVQPFRLFVSPDSHRLTNYNLWYRTDKAYPVHAYHDKYEPYLIIPKSLKIPKLDERFTGYGMNKVAFITELFVMGFRFMVLPDMWLIHLPHKSTSFAVDFLQNPYQRLKNRVDRFEFVAEVLKKHNLSPCR